MNRRVNPRWNRRNPARTINMDIITDITMDIITVITTDTIIIIMGIKERDPRDRMPMLPLQWKKRWILFLKLLECTIQWTSPRKVRWRKSRHRENISLHRHGGWVEQ